MLPLLASVLISTSLYAQSAVQIVEEDGLLTVLATDVSAVELAQELAQELGISVVVTGDAEARVNVDIVEEPLERALGKLSPNNLLVRSEDATEIVEVVLMMGEGQNNASGGESNQFLPSGSPTEGIVEEQISDPNAINPNAINDPNAQNDPNQSAAVRRAVEDASADPNLPAEQLPPMYAEDVQNELAIDPATGLPTN